MKSKTKNDMLKGIFGILSFVVWTILIITVDVQTVGVNNSNIGFATVNIWFHKLTGTNIMFYNITDCLGLVPILVCFIFATVGFIQLIKRKKLNEVDVDIIVLGIYYIIVILFYFVFEMIPINYRPILINGYAESSYPSSTTLLVLSVMPTLVFQTERRLKNSCYINFVYIVTTMFSVFMVTGRLISGVHWLTDIIGSILLSAGLFYTYKSVCAICEEKAV